LKKIEKGEECHLKDLLLKFVKGKICSKPTLLKHKKELEDQNKIKKIIGKDGRPCYIIHEDFLEEAKKLRLEIEIEKVGKKLIEQDKAHQSNFTETWLNFAKFMLDSILENYATATQLIVKDPNTEKNKVVYVLSTPLERFPEKFKDPTKEDFHYLPHALLRKIHEWGKSKLTWYAEKRRLELNPTIMKKIAKQKDDMLEKIGED